MISFRSLSADEIQCRISRVTPTGLSLLLYISSYAAQKILDESVTPAKWQRSHPCQNREFCIVSIYDDELEQWVSKEDVGTESFAEKIKGQASDSFKRACANWGIGRELRTAPFIWVSKQNCEIQEVKGKLASRDKFYVSRIEYDNGKIMALEIKKEKTSTVVFRMGEIEEKEKVVEDVKIPNSGEMPMSEPKRKSIKALCRRHGVDYEALLVSNNLADVSATENDAAKIIQSFMAKYGDEE